MTPIEIEAGRWRCFNSSGRGLSLVLDCRRAAELLLGRLLWLEVWHTGGSLVQLVIIHGAGHRLRSLNSCMIHALAWGVHAILILVCCVTAFMRAVILPGGHASF